MQRRHAIHTLIATLAGGLGGARGVSAAQGPAQARRGPHAIDTRDGTRLHYRDWGSGPPIVFVAPWALNSDWWDMHLTAISNQGFRCVAFDRRGHGRSDEPARGYDFDTLADDLAAVLEQLDLQNAVLVGHSMGAAEVVRYVTRHRARRVARVALIATVTPFILKTSDNPEGVAREVLEQGRAGLRRDFHHQIAAAAAGFFGAPKNGVSTETLDWWTRMIVDRCSMTVMLDLHRTMTETDFRAELATIAVPTLIVHGDSDTSAPLDTTGRRTHRLMKWSELKVYEGAAHGLPVTHADRLQADLLAFARR